MYDTKSHTDLDTKSHTDLSRDDSNASFGNSNNNIPINDQDKDSVLINQLQINSGSLIHNYNHLNQNNDNVYNDTLDRNNLADNNHNTLQSNSNYLNQNSNKLNYTSEMIKSSKYNSENNTLFYSCERASDQKLKQYTDSPVQTMSVNLTDQYVSCDNTLA